MTRPRINQKQLVLCMVFGIITLLGCAAIISFGVRMDQAAKEQKARLEKPWSTPAV